MAVAGKPGALARSKTAVRGNNKAAAGAAAGPNVEFVRNELSTLIMSYDLIRDCLGGEEIVKKAQTKYLPMPNPLDQGQENLLRYENYLRRAIFYNVTARTLSGLVGQIFLRPPVAKLPTNLQMVCDDCTGEGVPADQLAKSTANYVLAYGRAGLMVDYPDMAQPASVAEITAGTIRATFKLFAPWDVINWRTIKRGAEVILSLVVIEEGFHARDDGFEVQLGVQWRVLRLLPQGDDPTAPWTAQIEIWQGSAQGGYTNTQIFYPRDVNGQLLTELPFTFVGSENNASNPDNPPLSDMAHLNMGHYRNSADYEESSYMVGQPTPWVSGVTKQWIDDVFKGRIQLGSRAIIPLPINGAAGLLQASPNIMPKEAMDAKERQMVALGAKLIQQATVQRTATETDIENTAESSTLGASAKNVAAAFQFCFKWAARFMGGAVDGISYSLNTEFDLTYMDFNELLAIVKAWQAGVLTDPEIRDNLRRAGLATEDDATALPVMKAKAAAALEALKPAAPAPNLGGDPAKTGHPANNAN